MLLKQENNQLILSSGNATLYIQPWGTNGLRIQMTREPMLDNRDFALTEPVDPLTPQITIEGIDLVEPWYREDHPEKHTTHLQQASIINGKITARIDVEGNLSFYNQDGKLLLKEYFRNRNRLDRYCVPTMISAREMKPILGTTDYELHMRFESQDTEKLYGMGQYQDSYLNRKGSKLELCHRNSQASIPFVLSNLGYGFLWNNPAIGDVTFGQNLTEWVARSTKKLDYYITAGDTPKDILSQYTAVTGRVPMMPEYGLGFWQCKLRYRNQEELLNVAREYKRRGLPLDVIVIDFFHWTKQGEFRFDPIDWPDPEGMIQELNDQQIKLMVSVWPTVDTTAATYSYMQENGYLVGADRGMQIHMNWMGDTVFFDATNPSAQQYVWEQCRKNYYDKGVTLFWLDEAEPEYGPYDFDLYRYSAGPALQIGNLYPVGYAKAFYDGMKTCGQEQIVNLLRCGWAGSQKYGALIWSGDISSTFRTMREQLQIGLNIGIAGIPWWTTDIGGFLGGYAKDPKFVELLIRWFEWAVFCPVFRLHGERQPWYEQDPTDEYRNNVKQITSGHDNEVWSFGEEAYLIFKEFIMLRESFRPYIRFLMKEAHENGSPLMRAMFYEFPDEKLCWELTDQYMFGSEVLVAPILEDQIRERKVYLPCGSAWRNYYPNEILPGGQTITVSAPINQIPFFLKETFHIEQYE